MLNQIKEDLQNLANPEKAKVLSRYFKTGKGEYSEGDVFLGISVPEQRKVAKNFKDTGFDDLRRLLQSKIHEYRFTALEILNFKYDGADNIRKKEIVDFCLKNINRINNWDLVDTFAPYVFGDFLNGKNKKVLYRLATSETIWERRIAIISTFAFIKNNLFEDSFKIAEILLNDKHDLIHKAVGWMLREIGKKDRNAEEEFLKKHYKKMPRTMLRYAIERFSEDKKRVYMTK